MTELTCHTTTLVLQWCYDGLKDLNNSKIEIFRSRYEDIWAVESGAEREFGRTPATFLKIGAFVTLMHTPSIARMEEMSERHDLQFWMRIQLGACYWKRWTSTGKRREVRKWLATGPVFENERFRDSKEQA